MKMQGPPAYQDEGKKSGFEKRKQTKSTSVSTTGNSSWVYQTCARSISELFDSGSRFGF